MFRGVPQLGRLIAAKGGVVTAEQMAPYLDLPKGGAQPGDEGYVVPALLKFGGHPEVDDSGNLLYTFPDLQRSGGASQVRAGESPRRVLGSKLGAFSKSLVLKKLGAQGADGTLRALGRVACGAFAVLMTAFERGLQQRGVVERPLYKAEWTQSEADGGQKAGTTALVRRCACSSNLLRKYLLLGCVLATAPPGRITLVPLPLTCCMWLTVGHSSMCASGAHRIFQLGAAELALTAASPRRASPTWWA